jgi:hemerythrin HHE cation binding domain-containing protein
MDAITAPSPPAAFLQGFAAIHHAMRRDAARLPVAIERAGDTRANAALLRWFDQFRTAIEHHHEREDDTVWPALVERSPGFAADLATLAADHVALDAAMHDTRSALADRAAGHGPASHAVGAAERLRDLLVEHLTREEAAAFDRLAAAYTAEEYHAVERAMATGMSARSLAFVLPWVMEGVEPLAEAEMLHSLPAPIRAAYRLVFRRRYSRLSAPLR